jgi:HAE1 family hydrophobic/amphiphilic exporter-1
MYQVHKKVAYKALVLISSVILVFGGVSAVGQLEGEQMPSVDSELMLVTFEFPTGTTFETRKEVIEQAQEEIVQIPFFETSLNFPTGEIYVLITPPTERSDSELTAFDISDDLDKELSELARTFSGVRISSTVAGFGPPPNPFDVTLEIKDNSLEDLRNTAEEIEQFALRNDSVERVVNGYDDNLVKSIEIDFSDQALSENGISNIEAAGAVNAVFSSREIGKITVNNEGVSDNLSISFADGAQDSVEDLRSLQITPGVLLQDIAQIEEVESLNSINRIEGQRAVQIDFELKDGADAAEFQEGLEEFLGLTRDNGELTEKDGGEKLDELGIDSGAESVSFGGFLSDVQGTNEDLMLVSILAMIAVYIILINQFNSYIKPALIMLVVLTAFSGVFPGLFIFDESINLVSGLGIVALIGIAVNDAIVFVDTFQKKRKEEPEKELSEILAETGKLRFKPILSTTLTTILGILPLAIADPFWRGLGVSLIFGLIFSTLATLVIMPTVYKAFVWFWANGILMPVDKLFKRNYKDKYESTVYGDKRA